MREFAEAPGAVTILAEDGERGELAGFCIVQLEERVGYVVTLDVDDRWRRRGLALRLVVEVERRVREAGGLAMALHVYTGNAGAIRFYEAMGYVRAELAEGFYASGVDAWVYEKRLAGALVE
jgi:ribosomal protein S18 acetylase RimI-like enzyme